MLSSALISGFALPDPGDDGDVGDRRALRAHPPPIFQLLLQTKHLSNSTLGRPLRGAWVALGWPKGDPWVTQTQTQTAEGRNSLMPRGAKIAAQQTVIVSERRSRESNDLNQAKPYR
jgi:hypothetical protein